MTTAPRVSICMVTYNAEEYVRKNLSTLRQRTDEPFELVVVDNDSAPSLRAWLQAQADAGVIDTLILNDENVLWSPAVNQALAAASAHTPYLLLLNPDIEVLDSRWLSRLVGLLESRPTVGFAGTQRIWHPVAPVYGGVDGHCLLARREIYDRVGGLDERYLWWGGALKWIAAGHAAGFRYRVLDAPVLLHYEGRSNAEREDPIPASGPDYSDVLREVGLTPGPPSAWALLRHRVARSWRRWRRRKLRHLRRNAVGPR